MTKSNWVIGNTWESYKCDKCGHLEVHHVELWLDGNVYECTGCGHLTDTRSKKN
jgi:uncharacterized Zn finger protein